MPAPIQLPSPVLSNETRSTGIQTIGPAIPSEHNTGTSNEPGPRRFGFGKLIPKDNTARNDTRPGPRPMARECPVSPPNQLQRSSYYDHDAWRKAANEYDAERANMLWT
ncbi:hypothetical protein N7493_000536 [Penicillium malachiteum]|uniref:Uncharacterized protein n=1 Tax=Penicillium malachiteum TaxID=1324776 RepID=A0AAD6N0Z1_9EURO|nr:hypothetical protein N7493_000536 [Penicillium malachiteum]